MSKYSLVHLSDAGLHRGLHASAARKRVAEAELLAHIAEFDERKLYLPAAYGSMRAYCVGELHLSEDAASKRTQVARVARQFPVIFSAIEDGRLHLTGLNLLAPHLRLDTVDELLAAATHKTKAEILKLLADRSQPGLALGDGDVDQHAPAHVTVSGSEAPADGSGGQVQEHETKPAPAQVENRGWSQILPLAGGRFSLRLTIDQATLDLLKHAQALLGHQVPSGDLGQVFRRSLETAVAQFEKRKFAATASPRPQTRGRATANARYIPAHVRRAVRERDGDQCTYVSDTGRRCEARGRLEYDHVAPVARGGESTVDNLRLRCRGHNHYEAERAFGVEFMRHKQERAQVAAKARAEAVATEASVSPEVAEASARVTADVSTGSAVDSTDLAGAEIQTRPVGVGLEQLVRTVAGATGTSTPQPVRDWFNEARVRASAGADSPEHDEFDVVPWLRKLGVRAEDARRAAAWCETIPDAPLSERIRVAIRFLYAKPPLSGRAERTVA